ncbi:MAG: portal protein [crAssphage sp. isolate ctbg_1]|uniref:Putative portal protein n=1 Tax=crAssphage sp. isolate ctbg_1 TaxID=2989854 RepID=A0A345MT34_9CAUD|nr:MAG: portal protein [crAssphage sp. isolate ctbg_1]AXH74534.1 MAG: putative portal protein [crAssphage sp. isolate ctbg_1]
MPRLDGFRGEFQNFPFPNQRVSDAEKNKAEWYANCCDWIIAQGQAIRDEDELEVKYGILKGYIPDKFYHKILNPYNSTEKKYTRFPATMRNYDMIRGILRRYVSEYIKNPHDFIVSACNPEVVLSKNAKLAAELRKIVEQQIANVLQQKYAEFVNEGNPPEEFNPQEQVDVEKFIKEFNENYIDDISKQGQDLLNVIQNITDDILLYARAYFDWVSVGECYTYSEVIGDKLIKRNVAVRDAFPVPNDNIFAEDYDMFAERQRMTYQQIIDNFDEYLTDKDRKFLNNYYAKNSNVGTNAKVFNVYEEYFPDVCSKFNNEERDFFRKQPIMMRDVNADLYDVWHVVWRGERRMGVVTYVDESGFVSQKVVPDNYKLDVQAGDINIEYFYEPQVYESVRIGTRNTAIYPYKARAIAYNRNGKLPYNGINELLPGFGKFSIIEEVLPYQVFYNIVAYHREMVIAKHKMNILLIAKSLLGKVPEKTIYQMIADGVLYIDDENDQGMIKAQQVRYLTSNMGDYINQLTNLLVSIEEQAKNQVDMTPQRYGEIANSAGKGVTEEAINRGSMGSVIVEWMLDCMRERDYNRDLDYTKFAWIDGLDTSIREEGGSLKYISLDVDKHMFADYIVQCKNSAKEMEKLQQLKQYAFNASQNGNDEIAIAAITGDNVATIKKLIKDYKEIQRQHELEMQQMEQQTEQMKQEFELQKIAAKGEQDRATKELEGYLDQQLELIRVSGNIVSYGDGSQPELEAAANERLKSAEINIKREQIRAQREANMINAFNANEDRKVKMHDIDTKLKIAKENKNRYDVKSKSKSK